MAPLAEIVRVKHNPRCSFPSHTSYHSLLLTWPFSDPTAITVVHPCLSAGHQKVSQLPTYHTSERCIVPDSEQRASSSRKEITGFPAPKKKMKKKKKTYSLKGKIESIRKCYNKSKKSCCDCTEFKLPLVFSLINIFMLNKLRQALG